MTRNLYAYLLSVIQYDTCNIVVSLEFNIMFCIAMPPYTRGSARGNLTGRARGCARGRIGTRGRGAEASSSFSAPGDDFGRVFRGA